MGERRSARSDTEAELSPLASLAVVGMFTLGGVLGYAGGGFAGSFLGAIGAAGTVVLVMWARRGQQGLREGASLDLNGLDPRQALGLMSAMHAGGGGFASPLLQELEEATQQTANDAAGALSRLRTLEAAHPRTPAVQAQLARCLLALDDNAAAHKSMARALALALDGGMNPSAAKLFAEFENYKAELALAPRHLAQLARVLRSVGDSDAADWCDEQAAK